MPLILKRGEEEEERGGLGSSRLGSDFLVGKQVRQLVRGVRSAVQGPTGRGGCERVGLVDSGLVRRQGCAQLGGRRW